MYVLLGAPYPFFVFFHRVAPTGFRSLGAARFRASGTVGGKRGNRPPPPIFAGIKAKPSPLKNIGLMLPPEFSDLLTALALVSDPLVSAR